MCLLPHREILGIMYLAVVMANLVNVQLPRYVVELVLPVLLVAVLTQLMFNVVLEQLFHHHHHLPMLGKMYLAVVMVSVVLVLQHHHVVEPVSPILQVVVDSLPMFNVVSAVPVLVTDGMVYLAVVTTVVVLAKPNHHVLEQVCLVLKVAYDSLLLSNVALVNLPIPVNFK